MNAVPPTSTLERFQAAIDEFRRLRAEVIRLPRMERAVAEFVDLMSRRPACFNSFEVLRIGTDEVVHTGVLAWLLDASAGHGQGPLFLNTLAQALDLPISPDRDYRYLVRREFSGREAIIDVCVCRPHDFIIYIENKVWAGEGSQQVDREMRDLHRTAEANGIPMVRRYAIFLTPDGRPPTSGDPSKWLCLSYAELVGAVGSAVPAITDAKAAGFVSDWLEIISEWGAEP